MSPFPPKWVSPLPLLPEEVSVPVPPLPLPLLQVGVPTPTPLPTLPTRVPPPPNEQRGKTTPAHPAGLSDSVGVYWQHCPIAPVGAVPATSEHQGRTHRVRKARSFSGRVPKRSVRVSEPPLGVRTAPQAVPTGFFLLHLAPG